MLLTYGTADDVISFRSLDLASNALTSAGMPVETDVSIRIIYTISRDGSTAATVFAMRVLA